MQEAELEVTSSWGAENWRFERDGDTLEVASPDRLGWFGWRGWFGDGGADAVLLLPAALEGLDADVSLAAGQFVTDGDFGELDLSLAAGSFDVSGSAESLSADVSAGTRHARARWRRRGGADGQRRFARRRAHRHGPDVIEADVSAGTLRMTVPEGDYDVTSDVSAGEFENEIGSTPGASSTIRVQVSAGQAVLKAGR